MGVFTILSGCLPASDRACAPADAVCNPFLNALLYTVRYQESLTPRFLYAANGGVSGAADMFAVNGQSGALTPMGSVAAGVAPYGINVDPFGRFVYAANSGVASNSVSGYELDFQTGALRSLGETGTGGSIPERIAIHPRGQFLYVVNRTGGPTLFTVNRATGALTSRGLTAAGTGSNGVDIHPTGNYLYVLNQVSANLYTFQINQTTGQLSTPVSIVAAGTSPVALRINPAGTILYVAAGTPGQVLTYSIDANSGAPTAAATTSVSGTVNSVALTPDGKYLFEANGGTDNVVRYAAGSDGSLSPLGTIAAGPSPVWLEVDGTGRFLYVADSLNPPLIYQYAIEKNSGSLSFIGTTPATAGANGLAIANFPR